MLGLGGKPKTIAEHEAEGEIERVYHEIRQTLRVSGVNLIFRTWAGYGDFLPLLWSAIRPNLETRVFEDAADRVRSQAVDLTAGWTRLGVPSRAALGESQAYQVQAALSLYHYINPKLLVLVSAVRNALGGAAFQYGAAPAGPVELIERGVPARMYPMEMVDEEPDDKGLRDLFEDIKDTLSLPSINNDYRTLALWPNYLRSLWAALKPLAAGGEYDRSAHALRETAVAVARDLPYPIRLSRDRLEEAGVDAEPIIKTTANFERILPSLIVNMTIAALDWWPADVLAASPFPAATRPAVRVRKGGA